MARAGTGISKSLKARALGKPVSASDNARLASCS